MTSNDSAEEMESIDPGSIVVAVDGSEDAGRAVSWAAEQAFLERRPLTVLTTVGAPELPGISWSGRGVAYAEHPREVIESGERIVTDAADLAHHLHAALSVTTLVLVGDPRQVLVDVSRRVHLIVLGSRGRGLFRSKLLGSVSAAVSRDAVCPVLVCRPLNDHLDPDGSILLGADGTPESLPVIEFAFQQASLRDLPLTIVHCIWDAAHPTHTPAMVPSHETGLEEYRLLLAESVAGMASKYPEVSVDLRLARGLAEEFLSEPDAPWSLIVVGRHPVDSLLRLVTGAVATAVVERARTTVAVVPQLDPPDPEDQGR